ncbi:MAG: sulfurtransferase [Tepidimonas ignava]|jgi:thiosulfate/3-mercaptopyruvate sulfurtransferase|uniref:Thiosulfate sulfurtransferase n=1 Tax=Tepidimonas ignava TaxID=114249 RepID=A0A4R3LDV1_9BURK|nr:rhodanese-like domain-containing protein [Tepidimonas ignava]TCS98341.1 thiosulfate/3-mercaptopyruvate sulfurtransferase [Tepidimonas ignava]TSE21850.1 putative thiosulfate sulfurtransferase [Tepidimonas ignava]
MRLIHRIAATLGGAALTLSAWAQTTLPGPVVSTQWLADNLANVQVIEIRNDPKSFTSEPEVVTTKDGKKQLEEFGGHIPGSRLFVAKELRTQREINGNKVSYMLPERAAFEKVMQAVGVLADKPIVLVPEGQKIADYNDAARLYILLKSYADTPVAMLEGGMVAWLLEGRPWSKEAPATLASTWRATADRLARYVADSPDVAAAMEKKDVQLVDPRATAMYLGIFKRDYVYAYGHIPGARNVPLDTLYVTRGGVIRLLKPEVYRAVFQAQGVDPTKPLITYCNSGNDSSLPWFIASEILGNAQARNYDGSLHQWTLEKRAMNAPVPAAM